MASSGAADDPDVEGQGSPPTGTPWHALIQELREATLGEFEILGEIGRGGMAVVVLAHEIAVDRKVAIKVMSPGILSNEGMIDRFRQEARTVANLSHANIVTLYRSAKVGDLNFFVMKYVDGKPLDRIISAHGALGLPVTRAILSQVGGALSYAHRRGVIHRDVKPANILLDAEGVAFVTDFGIAKIIESPSQTSTGAVHGTAAYMSPEQCYAYPLEPAADQYSLGVVAYEMLAGRPPFVSASSFGLMQAHTTAAPQSVRTHWRECPPDIDDAVLRMLAKKPEDRWPSILDALAALGAVHPAPNDPVHAELARVVGAGAPNRLAEQFRTPVSPIPPGFTPSNRRKESSGASTPASVPRALVRRDPLVIRIAPPSEPIEVGDELSLDVTRTGGDESDQTRTARWSSSAPEIATVDVTRGVVTACAPGLARVSVMVEGASDSIDLTVVPARAAAVRITPAVPSVAVGEELSLRAEVTDRRGAPLVRTVRWSTSAPEAASVTQDGVVTGHVPGTVSVTAACDGARGEIRLSVTAPQVAGIQMVAGRDALVVGEVLQLTATVVDARDVPIPGKRVKWKTTNKGVATVTQAGLVTAVGTGGTEISASCDGHESALVLTVEAQAVAAVEIAPVRGAVTTARKFRLNARALDSNGRELERPITWRSSDPAIAEVSSDGAVLARAPGRVTIVAAAGGCEGVVEFVVAAPTEVPVAPPRPPRKMPVVPLAVAGAVAVAVVGYFALDGESVPPPPLPRPVDTATTDTGTPRPPGPEIRGGKPGTVDTPTVIGGPKQPGHGRPLPAVLVITPLAAPLPRGDSVALVVTKRGAAERFTPREMTWSSTNTRVATVSARGVVRAVGTGPARIIVAGGGAADTIDVSVIAPPPARVARLELPRSPMSLTVGASGPVRVTARDASGAELRDRPLTYTSSEPSVASVDNAGVVTALKAGTVAITASSDGVSGTLIVRIEAPPEPPDSADVRGENNLTATRVFAGGALSCAAREGAGLLCWGRGGGAAPVTGTFSSVSVGATHACGLSNGEARCWGTNDQGQLGNGTTASPPGPVSVGAGVPLRAIAAGGSFTCALDGSGMARCWGRNNEGQLGTGDREPRHRPAVVAGSVRFTSVATGAKHACGVSTDNVAYCWGDGFASAVGAGGRREFFVLPTRVDTRQRFTDVVAGDNFSCGLSTARRVYCWGENRSGQIGDGSRDERETPSEVRGSQTFTQITAGRYHACGLTSDGSAYCWGANEQGQLGNGTRASRPTPAAVDTDQRFGSISAGATHTCAVTRSSAVHCWGANRLGQLGPGGPTAGTLDSPSPIAVRAP